MEQTAGGGKSRAAEVIKKILPAAILILCEIFFFRNILGNGNMPGDRGDGRLTNLITEHWWQVFRGNEKITDLRMFFPVGNDLGYSDMFFGYGLVYSVFRLFGADMFLAYKITLILFHCAGTAAMYILLKKTLNLSAVWSLFGTLAFSFSNAMGHMMGCTQLMSVSWLPLLLILSIGFARNFGNRDKRNVYAYLLIVNFALLTYTCWYVAFFTGMYCLVFAAVHVVRTKLSGKHMTPVIEEWVKVLGMDLAGYVFLMIALSVPFLLIYLPIMSDPAAYDYGKLVPMLPMPIDFFNVPKTNLVLGGLLSRIFFSSDRELECGFSLVLFGVFALGSLLLIKFSGRLSEEKKRSGFMIVTAFLSVIICMLLITKLGLAGQALWSFVYYIIPGAKSISAVSRFMLWLSFPAAVAAAYCADALCGMYENKKKLLDGVSYALLLLLFLSNIDKAGVSASWNADSEREFISGIAAPPEDAQCFYITDSARSSEPDYVYQVDAFEIATVYGISTINGCNNLTPSGWDGIGNVNGDDYESNVKRWIEQNELTSVYAYDRANNTWTCG